MGTSTDAILFYGFHLSEDQSDDLPFGEEGEFEDFDTWLEHLGGINHAESPWNDYPDLDSLPWEKRQRVQDEWFATNQEVIDSWLNRCREARESITTVEMGYHYCDEYSLPYFYVCETMAPRGDPKRIESLSIPDGADAALQALAEMLGVENPEIGWWLVSWWG